MSLFLQFLLLEIHCPFQLQNEKLIKLMCITLDANLKSAEKSMEVVHFPFQEQIHYLGDPLLLQFLVSLEVFQESKVIGWNLLQHSQFLVLQSHERHLLGKDLLFVQLVVLIIDI